VNKYDQTTITLPEETKRKVRILAAEMGIPMGKAALKLIELDSKTTNTKIRQCSRFIRKNSYEGLAFRQRAC
jgi:hypothetical protein